MRNASAAKKEGNGIKKRKSKQERRFFLLGLLFVSPWLIGFLCFQLYPILSALYYSFTDFNIFQPAEFTGLDNYVTLFNDKYFPVSIKNTAVMSFIGMPIGLVVALALAVLLSKEVKGMPAFRTIYYLPTVVPIVASAMLFLWVLNPEYGLLNNFLSWFGIRGPSWLSDPKFTKISLMIMDVWRCGQNTVIFLSALKAVPKSFYEAAELDGANKWQQITSITLPCLIPSIITLLLMQIGKIFYSDFGLFYQVPQNSGSLYAVTNTIDTYVYRALMTSGGIGRSSAAGVFQSVVGFTLVMISNLVVKKVSAENAIF